MIAVKWEICLIVKMDVDRGLIEERVSFLFSSPPKGFITVKAYSTFYSSPSKYLRCQEYFPQRKKSFQTARLRDQLDLSGDEQLSYDHDHFWPENAGNPHYQRIFQKPFQIQLVAVRSTKIF